jgi:hypothetical protein
LFDQLSQRCRLATWAGGLTAEKAKPLQPACRLFRTGAVQGRLRSRRSAGGQPDACWLVAWRTTAAPCDQQTARQIFAALRSVAAAWMRCGRISWQPVNAHLDKALYMLSAAPSARSLMA